MVRSKEYQALLAGFVADIVGLASRVQRDLVQDALQSLGVKGAPLEQWRAAAVPRRIRRAAAPSERLAPVRRTNRQADVEHQDVAGTGKQQGARRRRPAAPTPELHGEAADASVEVAQRVPREPPQLPPDAPELTDREALVLDAVRRFAGRTAAEIAPHCGLPNGTAYVVLRALLAKGCVVTRRTTRGIAYRLASHNATVARTGDSTIEP
jgi:DNA-binding NarL/FixJ family response regulator